MNDVCVAGGNRRTLKLRATLALLAGGLCSFAASRASGAALTIDFEAYKTGSIMGTQYQASHGVTISADNYRVGGPDKAILFNSNRNDTPDDDLEFGGTSWAAGNIATGVNLNKFLIVAENIRDAPPIQDGYVDEPDDEAEGGTLFFKFSAPQTAVGFDLIDVELNPAIDHVDFVRQGVTMASITFDQFANPASPFYNQGVVYADRSANRIAPITVASLRVLPFDEVRFYMPECAAIDNLKFDNNPAFAVPEPGSAALTLSALAGAVGMRTRRRRTSR
jgi:hypothetical protein